MRVGILALVLAAPLVSGCQSGFSQFYEDYSGPWQGQLIAPSNEPRVVSASGSIDDVVSSMWSDGYALIGISSFNGPNETREAAIDQARKVGAEIIVMNVQYTNTSQGAIPITTQQTVTSNTRGSVSSYGASGPAYGTYSGTTTTVVPQTTYIPYAIDRYDQSAFYFGPLGPPCLGIYWVGLTDDEKRSVGSNRGTRVMAVRRNSPAYISDIIPGDLLLTLDGQPWPQDGVFRRGVSSNIGVRRGLRDISIRLTGGDGCPA